MKLTIGEKENRRKGKKKTNKKKNILPPTTKGCLRKRKDFEEKMKGEMEDKEEGIRKEEENTSILKRDNDKKFS